MGSFLDGVGSFLKKGLDDVEGAFTPHQSSPAPQLQHPTTTPLQMGAAPQMHLTGPSPAQPTLQQPKLNVSGAPSTSIKPVGSNNPIQEFGEWANNNVVKPISNTVGNVGHAIGSAANDVGQFATGKQELLPGHDPASAVGNFVADTGRAVGQQSVNSLRTAGDMYLNAGAHLLHNQQGIDQFNKATAQDFSGSGPGQFLTPVVNTLKLVPDAAHDILFTPGANSSEGTNQDLNNSLLAPFIGVRNQSIQDAGQRYVTSLNAGNDYQSALKDYQALQKTPNAPASALQVAQDRMNQAAQASSAATNDFNSLDPAAVASNFGMGAMMLDPAARGAKVVGKEAVDTATTAVTNAAQNAHDAKVTHVAQQLGQPASFAHPDFDPDIVKSASADDLKKAEGYFNDLKAGKDLGSIATTTNENGYTEPLTRDGFQRYLALREASEQVDRQNAGHEFSAANPYAHVPTNHIDEAKLQQGLQSIKAQTEGGYARLPGGGLDDTVDPIHENMVNEAVASFRSPEEYRQSLIDSLYGANKKGNGVNFVKNDAGNGFTDTKRISDNTPFYSEYYKQYGKAPTRKAITDMVDQQLTGKKGEYDASLLNHEYSPEELSHHQNVYQQLQDREDGRQAHLDAPNEATDNVKGLQDALTSAKSHEADPEYIKELQNRLRVEKRAAIKLTDKTTSSQKIYSHSTNAEIGPNGFELGHGKSSDAIWFNEAKNNESYGKNRIDAKLHVKNTFSGAPDQVEKVLVARYGEGVVREAKELIDLDHQGLSGNPARYTPQVRNAMGDFESMTDITHPDSDWRQFVKKDTIKDLQKAGFDSITSPETNYVGVFDPKHIEIVKKGSSQKIKLADPTKPSKQSAEITSGIQAPQHIQAMYDEARSKGLSSPESATPHDIANAIDPHYTEADGNTEGDRVYRAIYDYRKDLTSPGKVDAKVASEVKDALGLDETNSTPSKPRELAPDTVKAATEKPHGLNTPEQNTAMNPYKSDLKDVKQGSYDAAIQNAQKAEQDVRSKFLVAEMSLKKLPKDVQQQFGEYHEGTLTHKDPKVQAKINQASKDWQAVTDAIHAHSQALGGNTNYLTRYAPHPWDLPEDIETQPINGSGKDFKGLNSIERKHRTIADGKQAGLSFDGDYMDAMKKYAEGSARALKKQALRRGFALADSGEMEKKGNLTLGTNDVLPLSEKGLKYAKGIQNVPKSTNILLRGYRKTNRVLIQSLLAHTPVHQGNVSMRAVPGLILSGHPLAGMKAAAGGTLGMFDGHYSQSVFRRATEDGTAAKAAQIGMHYDTSGHGILWRGLTPVHDQVARSIIHDLEKRNVPLNSQEARQAGNAGNNMMAQMNFEARHVSPSTARAIGDVFLARQFTPSKFARLKQAGLDITENSIKDETVGGTTPSNGKIRIKQSLGGRYARATVVGNVIATTALIAGIGYVFKQKSDDLKDVLLRALIDPAVPTPIKDAKGNTQEIHLLATDTADVSKLIGLKLVRGSDGHLGVSWNPNNLPETVGDYVKARLSPVLGDGVKIATNSNYANKPLYDPNADLPTRLTQAGTTLTTGSLPIPLQNLAYTQPVKDAVGSFSPGAKQILDTNSNGGNALTNTGLGMFGYTMKNDTTVGNGKQSTDYFSALNSAGAGLNNKEQDALDLATGTKKNPVTGAYEVMPNANDTRAKATALLDQPKVLDRLIQMNKDLAAKGQSIDPLYSLTPDQIKKYYEYQAMPPGGADRTKWQSDNKTWYNSGFQSARSAYFNSLPAGDPNRPQLDIQAPQTTPVVDALLARSDNMTDPAEKSAFYSAHPEVSKYFTDLADYTNKMRVAQGFDPLRSSPKADANTENFMNAYFAASTADRKNLRNQNPEAYLAMQNYEDNMSRYSLDKAAGQDQLIGQGDSQNSAPGQSYLKSAFSLGQYAIGKGVDANGNTTYDYAPSTNTAAGSTTGANAAVKITQGGSAFKGIGGYSGNSGGSTKRQKKQKLRVKHKRVRYTYLKAASRRGPVKSLKIAHEVGYSKSSGAIKITKPKVEV